MSNSIKELVNAFNMSNYFCDRVNTNFTVEGNKIVGLFAYGTDVARYLRGVGEEIIKQQYSSREVAGRHYNLNCFPFVLGANPRKKKSNVHNVVEVELADSTNHKVIHNLKMHLVNEFDRAVGLKVIARLVEEAEITEEEGHEWLRGAIKEGAFDESNPLRKDYLYCMAFDGEYFERKGYDSETFELFKGMYIQEFNSRLKECGLKKSDFYEDKDGMLYIKNVGGNVIENVAKYVKKEVAFDFRTPGVEDSKVKNFKDVLSSLISEQIEKSIDFYDYDVFTDEEKIKDGNNFVLVPLTKICDGQLEFLKCNDRYKINAKYTNLVSDIIGKTKKICNTNYESPVYAISNKGIAQLLPEIMEFPIAYNGRTGHFEFAADLGPSSSVRSPRSGSISVLLPRPGTGVAVPAADAKNNPDLSMSGQNPDDGYYSMQNLLQSIYKSTASITLKSKDNEITNSDDSDAVLVDGQGQNFSSTDSKSGLSRSESSLSSASTSSSINDAQVYQPFFRSSSKRGSNRNTM